MSRIPLWKPLIAAFFLALFFTACDKQATPEQIANYTTLAQADGIAYCGEPFSTPLQLGSVAGNNIGTATVANDAEYLYLAYTLDAGNEYYIKEAQSYVGLQQDMPVAGKGNPVPGRFPYKQVFTSCDLKKTAVFKIPLKDLKTSNVDCANQCYVALHAAIIRVVNGTDCSTFTDGGTAWGVGTRVGDDKGAWGMGFQYCTRAACEESWCAMSQGYWFSKPNVKWPQDFVKYGDNLTVTKDQGRALWPAKSNWVRKAFFQASALQLSKSNNNGREVHSSIKPEYNILSAFLSGLSYEDIKEGRNPKGADPATIQAATGKIGKWICQNHCNDTEDPTACDGL